MNELFCCFGLLRMRESVERVAAMLPDSRRDAARLILKEYSSLPEAEVAKRLAEFRRREREEMRGRAGAALERLSPLMQGLLMRKLDDGHGREDH